MRRTDKEITLRSEIDAVIRKARVCRLAMLDGDGPYIIPLSFGYDGDSLYFHSARKGKKLDLLRQNPRVCFEFDVDVSVSAGEVPCKWGMAFRSVIGFGKVEFISAPEACRRALDIIMAQYSDEPSFAYQDAELERISVFKVKILEMSGKRSG
ncbi:pyridoxamine 5'-phosphate oxidase family protein [Desulfococcus sp.]|uniref:pyridoxamine 5'-phosphate oxidase family protein n=1 Tax=Desulfococcus sp. TaxID=2025834 RepID=UPI003593D4C0